MQRFIIFHFMMPQDNQQRESPPPSRKTLKEHGYLDRYAKFNEKRKNKQNKKVGGGRNDGNKKRS